MSIVLPYTQNRINNDNSQLSGKPKGALLASGSVTPYPLFFHDAMNRSPRHTCHLYHVIVRVIERRPIFVDNRDSQFSLARFSALLRETDTQCLAWYLLTNHFHLISASLFGKSCHLHATALTSYAVTFNLRHKRSGHLFQNRNKLRVCVQSYVLELVHSVHLNPFRPGMANSLEELDSYPWYHHAVILGRQTLDGQTMEPVLEPFGISLRRSRRSYHAFLEYGLAAGAQFGGSQRLAEVTGQTDFFGGKERHPARNERIPG